LMRIFSLLKQRFWIKGDIMYHGYNPDQYDEDFALPDATTGYSDDFVWRGKTNGKIRLLVIAQTAISIATDKYFYVEFMAGSSANPTANPKAEVHTELIRHTSADGVLAWTAGEVMIDYAIPEALLASDDLYFRLLFTTEANESSELCDILVVMDGV